MKSAEPKKRRLFRYPVALLVVQWCLCFAVSTACGQERGGVLDTTQCRLRYDEGMEDDAHGILNVLASEYDFLSQQLGMQPKAKIEARLFKGMGTFAAEAGGGNNLRPAIYARGVLMIRPPHGVSEEKMRYGLSYEMARVFLSQPAQHSCPQWLVQAFALFHAGISPDCSSPSAAALDSFADLSQALQQVRKPADRADLDCLLAKTMQFFIDRYGEQKAFGLFRAFDGSLSLEQVFGKVFGEKPEQVERAWVRTVSQSPERP